MGSMGGGGAAGGAPAAAEAAEEAAPEEAAPKEKTHYDIELSKFDPAGKIKIIKEIRAIFGLGLKGLKRQLKARLSGLRRKWQKRRQKPSKRNSQHSEQKLDWLD